MDIYGKINIKKVSKANFDFALLDTYSFIAYLSIVLKNAINHLLRLGM